MKKRILIACESCGQVPCECDPNNRHSPGVKEDTYDNMNYDPFTPIDAEEPSVMQLLATV